jgi:putative lipoprotein
VQPLLEAEPSEPAEHVAYAFDCDDGTSLVSRLDANDDVMWVLLPDQAVDLGRVESASGTRYANDAVSFWLKGDEALLEIAGKAVTCSIDRFRSKVESVKLSGGDFWASGNEPGWVLEMYPDGMVFTSNYGEERHETGITKVSEDSRARMTVFRGESGDKILVVTLRGEPCEDTMSGEVYEATVRIDFGGQVYDGCGSALH